MLISVEWKPEIVVIKLYFHDNYYLDWLWTEYVIFIRYPVFRFKKWHGGKCLVISALMHGIMLCIWSIEGLKRPDILWKVGFGIAVFVMKQKHSYEAHCSLWSPSISCSCQNCIQCFVLLSNHNATISAVQRGGKVPWCLIRINLFKSV